MAKDHSFDIVSKVDMQELRNAIAIANKEVVNRFDFRGTSASIDFQESTGILKVSGDHEVQLKNVIDVVESKMARRGVSVRAFSWAQPEKLPSGGLKRQASLQQGLTSEKAKEIVKLIKDIKLKVQPRIDGDAVRVSGKQLDDLQAVIQAVQAKDFNVSLQIENYR